MSRIDLGDVWRHRDSGILVCPAPSGGGTRVVLFDTGTRREAIGEVHVSEFERDWQWFCPLAKLNAGVEMNRG